MKILLVYHDALQDGGYPRDVRWLASALAGHGAQLRLATGAGSRRDGLASSVELVDFHDLPFVVEDADIVHMFSLFLREHILAFRGIQRGARATVLSWMGHLMPLSLRVHRWRKTVILRLFGALSPPTAFHVFGPAEDVAVHHQFPGVPTFHASLGIFPEEHPLETDHTRTPRLELLFFGRNDVNHKGLDVLLEGFARAIRGGVDAHLTIAGQPWKGSDAFIRGFVAREALSRFVTQLGPVDEPTKRKLVSSRDYLVFLSRWDGPPRPIREAIALGTPVVVSPETNMAHLVDAHGAGVTVPLDHQKIATVFSRLSASPGDRAAHAAGIAKLRDQLQWRTVARDYANGYERILGSSPVAKA